MIKANCLGIVAYRIIVLIFVSVRAPTIVVDLGIVWVQSNRLCEISDGSPIVLLLTIGDSSIVRLGIIWVYSNRLGVVIDGLIVVFLFGKGVSSIFIEIDIVWTSVDFAATA